MFINKKWGENMTDKQKEVLAKLGEVIIRLNDEQLDGLLKYGSGMVIMADIMEKKEIDEAIKEVG